VDQFCLARVKSGSDREPAGAHRLGDRGRAADAAGGAVERRDEAVADGVDLVSAEALELTPDQRVVALEQVAPLAVAEPRRERRARTRGVPDERAPSVAVAGLGREGRRRNARVDRVGPVLLELAEPRVELVLREQGGARAREGAVEDQRCCPLRVGGGEER